MKTSVIFGVLAVYLFMVAVAVMVFMYRGFENSVVIIGRVLFVTPVRVARRFARIKLRKVLRRIGGNVSREEYDFIEH